MEADEIVYDWTGDDLPQELYFEVFRYLGYKEIIRISLCDKNFVSGTLWPLVRQLDIMKPKRRRRMLESALRCIENLSNITSLSLKLRSISSVEMKQVRELVPAVSDNLRYLYLNTRNSFCDATDLLPFVHLSKLKILIVDSRVSLTLEVLKSLPYPSLERLEIPIDAAHFEYLLKPMPYLRILQIRLEVQDGETAQQLPEKLRLLHAAHPHLTSLDIILEYGMSALFDSFGSAAASAEHYLSCWNEQMVFSPSVIRINTLGMWRIALRLVTQPFSLAQFSSWYRMTHATSTIEDKMEAILGAMSADPDNISTAPDNVDVVFNFMRAELRSLLLDPGIDHFISTLPILDWTSQLASVFDSCGENYEEESRFWVDQFKSHFRKATIIPPKARFVDHFIATFSEQSPVMMQVLDDIDFVQNSTIVRSLILLLAEQSRDRMYYGPLLRCVSEIVDHPNFELQTHMSIGDVANEIYQLIRLSDSILSKLDTCSNVFAKAVAAGARSDAKFLNSKLAMPSDGMSLHLQESLMGYFRNLIFTVNVDNVRMRYNRTKSLHQIKRFLDAHRASFEEDHELARAHILQQVWTFILGRASLTAPGSVAVLVSDAFDLFGGVESIPKELMSVLQSTDMDEVAATAKELVLSLEAIEEAKAAIQAYGK